MRLSRGWTQEELGRLAQMPQTQISRLERKGYENFSLSTLMRLASAFDVALKVKFVAFSELVDEAAYPEANELDVPSYSKDPGLVVDIVDEMRRLVVLNLGATPLPQSRKWDSPEIVAWPIYRDETQMERQTNG